MAVRIEPLADRIDFGDLRAAKRSFKRLQRQLGAGLQCFRRDVLGSKRLLERVLHGQKILGELLDRVLIRLCNVRLRLLARVFGVGARAKPCVAKVRDLRLGLFQQVCKVGSGVRWRAVRDGFTRLGRHDFGRFA